MQSPSIEPTREDMQQKIERFAAQVVTDLAAAMAGVMTNLGHKLGLYRAMAETGPVNSPYWQEVSDAEFQYAAEN